MNYRESGVDINSADRALDGIMDYARRTLNENVISGIGGFSGLYRVPGTGSIISAGMDGVGTKLKLAFELQIHDTVGIDCVAMNVNDVITSGLLPHIFLDYYACGKLEDPVFNQVIRGISEGCLSSGCVLLGGETAEMPGFYPVGEYDLAGCAIGIGTDSDLLPNNLIVPGDSVIGIPSTGPHSNGFSLIRKILSDRKLSLDLDFCGKRLGEVLLTPTRIYVPEYRRLKTAGVLVKGMVHITGGGFYENIPRILPQGTGVCIDRKWNIPDIFTFLAAQGKLPHSELFRVFNMGIGMILITDERSSESVRQLIPDACLLGHVTSEQGINIC